MFGCFCKCFNLKPHEFDPPWMWYWTAHRMSGCLHGKDCHAMQMNNVCDNICEYLTPGNIYLKLVLYVFLCSRQFKLVMHLFILHFNACRSSALIEGHICCFSHASVIFCVFLWKYMNSLLHMEMLETCLCIIFKVYLLFFCSFQEAVNYTINTWYKLCTFIPKNTSNIK